MTLRTISAVRGVSVLAIAIAALAAPSAAFAQAAAPPPMKPPQTKRQASSSRGFRASLESAVNAQEERRPDRRIDLGRRHRQAARCLDRRIDRAPSGPDLAAPVGPVELDLDPRLVQDFSTTLLNGREQTSTGDNRAVEYDQYPSEIVSRVNVYKSPMASLVGQGLSGTVDLRTIRPLDAGRQIIADRRARILCRSRQAQRRFARLGYRVNATYVDQFADDRDRSRARRQLC